MIRPFVLLLWVATIRASHQNYPGTSTRPILSAAEAALYTKSAYLGGWAPEKINLSHADYTVGSGGYSHIQEAINAAIHAGGNKRKYIHIKPGTYQQLVIIPRTTVPITIYGTQGSPGQVRILLFQGAKMTGAQFAANNNPGGRIFKSGDPGWNRFHDCARRATIGTDCSAVVWAQADNVEFAYVTIENHSINGQAVAADIVGNRNNWDHVHFYGFQDTLYLKGQHVYISHPVIKGDVDFIFGNGPAVLEKAEIIVRADRPRNTGIIFAPNTDRNQKYGFLLINSKITADDATKTSKGVSLARAWDSTSTSNGQVVMRETEIDAVINVNAPYTVAVGGRPYSGNANKNRNLDDPNHNRFWEYRNYGSASNGQVVMRETEIDAVININAPYTAGAGGRPYSGNANKNRNLDDPNHNRFWEYGNYGSGA